MRLVAEQQRVDAEVPVGGERRVADRRFGGTEIDGLGADDGQGGEVFVQRVEPVEEDAPGDDGELAGVNTVRDFGHSASRSPGSSRDVILGPRLSP
ncbi:hypothetical protein [Streptomyces sp. NRRL B-24720]|uniref:hypothetical protein n=1 Tax=Streptomyces sp. NRRL B-24720 TaxID=1476876 RepID=UPI001F4530AC|nr:hypothetical protein [Streptomyces sp. NRRL B-24720]